MAMKKSFIILSAAILALVACNKEISEPAVIEEPVVIEQEPTILTFSSERPQTKTAWDSGTSSIVWTSGDRIRVGYTLDGNWMGVDGPADFSSEPKVPAKFYVSNNVTINAEHANSGTFTVPTNYTNSPSGSAVFYGVYPSSSISSTDSEYAPSLTVVIPASQTPGANTFDKAADIMVGKTAATDLTGDFPTEPLALEWDRVVAHADITFKNLDVDGDASVNKITLAFNSEAKVVGTIYLDVTNGNVTTTGSSSNEIEIQGTNLSINEGNIEAWAAVLPVTFTSVDVTVKTDLATYTRSITGISKTFKKNARNTLGINMASATKTLNSILIPDGNYVIAAENSGTYYAISSAANSTSSRRDRSEITSVGFDPSNYSAVSPYTAANSLIWTITNVDGGVKINLAGDTNSYMAYGNNTLPLNDTGVTFEVAEDEGKYTFANSSRYISMNGTYGFGCYSTGSYVKDLYVIPATGTPLLSFVETSKDVAADASSVSFTYTSAFLAGAPTVTVTSDEGNAVASTSISSGTLTVNLNANSTSSSKSVTLTVSADGVSDVVLTITQSGVVPDAENGDVLWAEAFTGFVNNDVPTSSNGSTTVYGSRTVTYSCVDGGSTTKVYGSDNIAGGVAPELLISKSNGSFTASGIPTGNATGMTLTFKANNTNLTVSCTTDNSTVTDLGSKTYTISVPAGTKTITLVISNAEGSNTRIDDISLVAGVPVPGITVTTSAASSTATTEGTTATLNGSLALVNGAVNASVTEAGFYYKLTSAGSYTKVTCASAPTSTTSFSYDLAGLTKDAEYTYYAYAVYDDGDEVTGEETAKTFTPTQSGGGSEHVATINFGSASGSTNVNSASVSGEDSEGNTWTVTTVGTTSFTPNASYAQIGSSSNPATSITFTTTLASTASNISIRAKFGGFKNTAGSITLKVGNTEIGSGSLNAASDVTVSSSSVGAGTVVTVTVTGISKGVKAYWIETTYTN